MLFEHDTLQKKGDLTLRLQSLYDSLCELLANWERFRSSVAHGFDFNWLHWYILIYWYIDYWILIRNPFINKSRSNIFLFRTLEQVLICFLFFFLKIDYEIFSSLVKSPKRFLLLETMKKLPELNTYSHKTTLSVTLLIMFQGYSWESSIPPWNYSSQSL